MPRVQPALFPDHMPMPALATAALPPVQAASRYFLGVVHFWVPTGSGDGRSYHHYLYKMEASPPFRPLEVGLLGVWVLSLAAGVKGGK
jgi:hypothetical protein